METDNQIKEQKQKQEWTSSSWRSFPILQQPEYENQSQVDKVLKKLVTLPPLVHANEIERLKAQLAEAARGERFLLQGGDCAEIFNYCNSEAIEGKLKILIQMSLVLTYGARIPLVRIVRGAGQYAKPRSNPTENYNGQQIASYRGDNINGFNPDDRKHDPDRLLQAYFHSAATWNYVRALLSGGFADLHRPEQWTLEQVRSDAIRQDYQELVRRMLDALDFMKTIHAENETSTSNVDMFSSHEGLILQYEEALTRKVNGKFYNMSSHFQWIGDRTRQLNGAHIEYFRGIANPIGVKVGPSMKPQELVEVIQKLNPSNEEGKITLISRYGSDKVSAILPTHLAAVNEAKLNVLWCSDPMHGNTEASSLGLKTRRFDRIIEELSQTFRIHKEHGSRLGGVHLELTGDNVTECVGGTMEMEEKDLATNYLTQCDPRLNYNQSLDIAFLIARYYEKERNYGHLPSL